MNRYYGPTLLYVCNCVEDWQYRMFLLAYLLFNLFLWPFIVSFMFADATVGTRAVLGILTDLFIIIFSLSRWPVRYEVWSDSLRVVTLLSLPLSRYRQTQLSKIEQIKVEGDAVSVSASQLFHQSTIWSFAFGAAHPREVTSFSNIVLVNVRPHSLLSSCKMIFDLLITPEDPEELMLQLGRAVDRAGGKSTLDGGRRTTQPSTESTPTDALGSVPTQTQPVANDNPFEHPPATSTVDINYGV